MSKRFSHILLSGKISTLPMLIQNAYADYTPTFTDAINSTFTQIQVPQTSAVLLNSLGSSTYGTFGAAQICSNKLPTAPSNMSVVLTGLLPGDTVFVATATSTGGNESINPKIKIGTQKLFTPVITSVSGPVGSTINLTVNLSLSDLIRQGYQITQGGTFYIQSVAFPVGSISTDGYMNWSKARVTELDVISVGSCSVYSTYSTFPY